MAESNAGSSQPTIRPIPYGDTVVVARSDLNQIIALVVESGLLDGQDDEWFDRLGQAIADA